MKTWTSRLLTLALMTSLTTVGCSGRQERDAARSEHYTSPVVEGAAQRINLDEVQKAFWESKGKDFNAWMGAFEKRVNEIYEGKEVVSVDATRKDGKLLVTGFIDKDEKPGFAGNDDKLFTIEQTGEAAGNEMPYRVGGADGRPYYEGHHSLLDNPFLQMFLVSQMMNSWGGHYSTPQRDRIIIRDHRDSYRQSPQYENQRISNRDFNTRYKQKDFGGVQSNRKFGSGTFSSDDAAKNRSWSRLGRPEAGTLRDSSQKSWGGRRSSGFGGSGGSGWSGRRSSGSGSSGRSFGGRRR